MVVTRLGAVGGAVLDLVQEVRRDDCLLVRLELRIACIGRTGRPARLPPALRAALLPLGPTPEMVPAHAS
jgi:acyl-CoA thioester hydrolase